MTGPYDDILHLPHPTSKGHPRMPIADRAAQFSPFAALTGYEAAVEETARLTEEFVSLDEYQKAELNEKLKQIQEQPEKEVTITYFCKDEKKEGGAYRSVTGKVKKFDLYGQCIVMEDELRIEMETIVGIDMG